MEQITNEHGTQIKLTERVSIWIPNGGKARTLTNSLKVETEQFPDDLVVALKIEDLINGPGRE